MVIFWLQQSKPSWVSPRLQLGNVLLPWISGQCWSLGQRQIVLGLIIDNNKLTIAIPHTYLKEVLDLLNSTWHPNQHYFKVSKGQKLTGKLVCLTEGANWAFYLFSHIYSSIAYALSKNKRFLVESSCEFCATIEALQTGSFSIPCKDLARHTLFAIKRAGKLMHHALYQYNINKTMRHE